MAPGKAMNLPGMENGESALTQRDDGKPETTIATILASTSLLASYRLLAMRKRSYSSKFVIGLGIFLLGSIMLRYTGAFVVQPTPRVALHPHQHTRRRVFQGTKKPLGSPIISWEARRSGCFRPTVDDVERISWGQPARRKGTGSRGVPHRLDANERLLWDIARERGFLQVEGSGWRSQRREAPLLNSYRSLCDARGQAMLVVHKGNTGMDELVVDLSPLRTPELLDVTSSQCLQWLGGGKIHNDGLHQLEDNGEIANSGVWENEPIFRLPPFCISWELTRPEAKTRAKELAGIFLTAEGKRARSKKSFGLKPGKNRRHGGYGIG